MIGGAVENASFEVNENRLPVSIGKARYCVCAGRIAALDVSFDQSKLAPATGTLEQPQYFSHIRSQGATLSGVRPSESSGL
jgi:hypothetical protein